MNITKDLYKTSMALLTDLYQLTMAYGYWKSGLTNQQVVFNLFFRDNPFNGGFTVACGLSYVIDYLNALKFTREETDYLATLTAPDGSRLFEQEFLDYLLELEFNCDIEAVPEGTIVFPQEPIVRVKGNIILAQLIETPLLNILNFQTLIATKASRIYLAAKGEPVLEFGLRRAQGIDGAIAASRAAYIGGCSSTSNVLAGKLFGIPVSGTHAHSWVMSFPDELSAFKAYAEALPGNCVLLVDTYNTIEGVKHAIEVGKILEEKGKKLLGVRIDSGDLAYFSIEARKMLDAAGFTETKVIASNDLDENIISSLHEQQAAIDTWGIGTKLVTAFDQPALGAVYKLAAIENKEGEWQYKIKLSEQSVKVNNPGIQQVRRFYYISGNRKFLRADMIYDTLVTLADTYTIIDPIDPTRRKKINPTAFTYRDLLEPVFQKGRQVYHTPNIHEVRKLTLENLEELPSGIKRNVNPHAYPVGLEEQLYQGKTELILKLRNLD